MNNPLVIFMHRMQYSTRYKYIKNVSTGKYFSKKKTKQTQKQTKPKTSAILPQKESADDK